MNKKFKRTLAALAVIAAGSGSLLTGLAGSAGAAGPPPWQPVANPPQVGSLLFFNASGQRITGGNLTDSPIAAYVQGTATINSADNKAALYVYTPVNGQNPGSWSDTQLSSGATSYGPVTGAPSSVSTTLPVESGASGDTTLSQWITSDPNADTSSDGYAGLYELRLKTIHSGGSLSANYDSADILVTGSTWSVVYPALPAAISTTTALSETPTGPQQQGASVTLNATVTAADSSTPGGTVQFESGGVAVGSPVTLVGGAASLSTTALPVGAPDALSAVYTPAPFTLYSTSTGTSSYTITPAPAVNTTTTLGVSPTTSAAFTNVTLTATVAAADSSTPPGTVQFYDNGTSTTDAVSGSSVAIGSPVTPVAGLATLTYGSFGQGAHNIVAQFVPTSIVAYNGSTSLVVLYTATAPAAAPDVQNVNVTVPQGAITISTPYTSLSPLSLGSAQINSTDSSWDATAPFGTTANGGVTITDTRNNDQSWTASVLASNFATTGGTINGNDFSFTGLNDTFPAGNALNGEVTLASGGVGQLGGTVSHPFASAAVVAPNTTVDGTVNIFGTINLVAPTSTPAGVYQGTLTFTVS